jgi:hypothetical protein
MTPERDIITVLNKKDKNIYLAFKNIFLKL